MIFYSETPKPRPGEDIIEATAKYISNIVGSFGPLSEITIMDILRINNMGMFEACKRKLARIGIRSENGILTYGETHMAGYVYQTVPASPKPVEDYRKMIEYAAFLIRKHPKSLFTYTSSVQQPFSLMIQKTDAENAETDLVADLISSGHTFSEYKYYIENSFDLKHKAELNETKKYADNTYKERIILIMEKLEDTKIITKTNVIVAVPYKEEYGRVLFKGYDARKNSVS